eukprot:TRINITY_DN762_c0_g1_i2.p2 TRINITY_DN762_c0_g1~~TRINITY_DN762_c0_g1_i2.p2  ORF type:complete len:108 (+),score=21.11 TRINITY_DN762_c0_g1_i2:38-325(+)
MGIIYFLKKMHTKILVLLIACLFAIQAFAQEKKQDKTCVKNVGCGGCDTRFPPKRCGVRNFYGCEDAYECAIINGQCTMVGRERFAACVGRKNRF